MFRSTTTALALAVALSATTSAHADQFVRVGGGLAGTYPIFAAKLVELINANIPDVRANVVAGDIEKSLIELNGGELEIALAPTFTTRQIYDGNGSLGLATENVRHIMTLYGSYIQPIARPDGVDSLDALDDGANRVWMGQSSGFFYQVFNPMMEASGVTPASIESAGGVVEAYGYIDQVQGFQDGRLDAGVFAGPAPYSLMLQIEQSPGFKLIPMDDASLDRLEEMLPGIGRAIIPAGSYNGQEEDVQTPFYVNHLIASTNMSDELAYQITKVLYDNVEQFHGLFPASEEIDQADVLQYNVIPVHPGAQQFFDEVGAQ
ncbi:MAG: TAXI family TRAP transporter solute-binding subunit [Roseitalea sp.]|jgi:TRAP transporter TAXI family solute receptor|nr:TAXI family TRAP transporter solute-binding subunit [Roseitalea sp.]MBO6741462.1 TAXI family TRAP transporter solute-binding subunit [Roseitalea sp.]